jgi:prepilin-type N-terminal cleavage/methylation domain-containing protein
LNRRFGGARRAFTMLELLLTIALIALLASVLVGGAAHLLTDKPVTADEVFWKAVQEARKAALKSEKEVRLRFDTQKKQFVLIDGFAPSTLGADGFTKEETVIKQIPVPPPGSNDLAIDFLGAAAKGGPAILIRGVMIETQQLAYVTFYPDGTCTAFRAQVVRNGGTHMLAVDPWTCAAVLPTDPNARTP